MARVVILTRLVAAPGRLAELLAAFDELHDAVAEEAGTEVFAMHTVRDESDVVVFYESYRDDAALARHREGRAVRTLVEQLPDLVVVPPDVTYLRLVRAKGLPR